MNCKEFQIEVEENETGRELSPTASAHAAQCASCHRFYTEQRALRELVGKVTPIYAPADFDFRLRARLAASREPGRMSLAHFNFSPGNPAIIFAASFALLFAVTVAVQQLRSSHTERKTTAVNMQVGAEATSTTVASSPSTGTSNETQSVADNQPPVKVESVRSSGVNARNKARRSLEERHRALTTINSMQPRSRALNFSETVAPAPIVLLDPEMHIPLRSPLAPSRLFVSEHDGTRRDVSLKPVSFGSQNMLPGRKTSDSSTTGIW